MLNVKYKNKPQFKKLKLKFIWKLNIENWKFF